MADQKSQPDARQKAGPARRAGSQSGRQRHGNAGKLRAQLSKVQKLKAPPPKWGIAAGIVFLVGLVAGLLTQALVANALWMMLRVGWFWILLSAMVVVVTVVAFKNRRAGMAALLVVAMVAALITIGVNRSHQMNQNVIEASLTFQTDGVMPSYNSRPPFTVGENQAASHADTNGVIAETTYIPSDERFGTLVADSGLTTGYSEVIWQQVTGSGQSTADNCKFNDFKNGFKFDGWFGANLKRAILYKAGPESIDPSDAYGVCIDGRATVIVPLRTYRGVIFSYLVPDGVAVIDDNWNVTVDRDVTPGEYPGPVYPMSLAVQQRESTIGIGSWWDQVRQRVGYKTTGDNTDETNISEFNLARTDGDGADFVTPLALAGQAQSISAVGVVASDENHAGQLNPYTVVTLAPARQANSAVIDRLRSDYGNLQEWAAGMQVYEIIPTGPGTWQATLGMPKAVIYRAEINADGTSCLYSARTGAKIGCSGDAGAPPPSTTDLSGLTDAELAQLLQQVAAEYQRRCEAAGTC